ncbi:MAG: ATP-binding cassette domain-containing protein, partial [Deltaproteobacteria bacterium]|nr:ATP-binding cassette domain-containing protein [Deltaproteobacteria bacterium]
MMKDRAVMLSVKGLYKDFRGLKVIDNLSLDVEPKERHAIIGPNGAGKTTFYNLVTGKYTPSRGRILFKGMDITGMSPERINRLGISRSFQITNIFPGLSVFENVRTAVMSKYGIRYNLWKIA